MFQPIRSLLLFLVLATGITAFSCGSKHPDPTPLVQNSILSGHVSPADAATEVTATNTAGQPFTVTITSTGTYAFPPLPTGTYTLICTPVAGYIAPAAVPVALVAGGTTAPSIILTIANVASASFKYDGLSVAAVTTYGVGPSLPIFDSQSLRMYGSGSTTLVPLVVLHIDMPAGKPVVGSYDLNTDKNNGEFWDLKEQYFSNSIYTIPRAATSGTLTITSVNSTLRRYSGKFNFVGGIHVNPGSGGPAASIPLIRTVTEGIFANVGY